MARERRRQNWLGTLVPLPRHFTKPALDISNLVNQAPCRGPVCLSTLCKQEGGLEREKRGWGQKSLKVNPKPRTPTPRNVPLVKRMNK